MANKISKHKSPGSISKIQQKNLIMQRADPYTLAHKGYLKQKVYGTSASSNPLLKKEKARNTITYNSSQENLDLNVTMNSEF